MTPSDFEAHGFRWCQSTQLQSADGSTITVTPTTYVESKERPDLTDRELKNLRLYAVTSGEQLLAEPELTELQIEKLIGDE